jgi:hypothetical protein
MFTDRSYEFAKLFSTLVTRKLVTIIFENKKHSLHFTVYISEPDTFKKIR